MTGSADLVPGPAVVEVIRGGTVESRHHGSAVALSPAGDVVWSVGSVLTPVFPRSSLKPLQAVGMLRAGLVADDEELALVCASHSGQPEHVAVVERLLGSAGLSAADLDNTPDLPLHKPSATAVVAAGGGKSALLQNCSGKHAGMLATCVAAGWPTAGYRSPGHPLQRMLADVVAELCATPVAAVTVDGCGAPAFAVSLAGCALAFSRLAAADPVVAPAEARVAAAMLAHPHLVGGTGRDVTDLLALGILAKDGAEGVYVAALPSGAAAAVKIDDGSARARTPLLAHALVLAGARDLDGFLTAPVLGHGDPVGEIRVRA